MDISIKIEFIYAHCSHKIFRHISIQGTHHRREAEMAGRKTYALKEEAPKYVALFY